MKHIDGEWITRFAQGTSYAATIETKLRADNLDEKKSAFFDDTSKNPDLIPTIEIETMHKKRSDLEKLRDDIEYGENDVSVREAYLPRIEGLLGNIALLNASSKGDTDEFIHRNIESYGEVDSSVFNASLEFFRTKAEKALAEARKGSALAISAQQVIDVLPEGHAVFSGPTAAEFDGVKSPVNEQLDEMMDGIELPDSISGKVGLRIAQQAMDNLGFGYTAIPQKEGLTTMSAEHLKKVIKIPQSVKYTAPRFRGMMGHEGFVHINESIQGAQQPLEILKKGLAGYLGASEGKGILFEQVQYASMDEFRETPRFHDVVRRLLAVGLGRGTDGNGERDFTEVFKIVNAIDFMSELQKQHRSIAAASQAAKDRTWELMAMRTHRGYTGRGATSMKDKIYAEQNPVQWNFITAHPDIIPYLNVGKYDASNEVHLNLLKKTGSIPGDIAV